MHTNSVQRARIMSTCIIEQVSTRASFHCLVRHRRLEGTHPSNSVYFICYDFEGDPQLLHCQVHNTWGTGSIFKLQSSAEDHVTDSLYESTGGYRLNSSTLLNVHPKIEKLIPLLSAQTRSTQRLQMLRYLLEIDSVNQHSGKFKGHIGLVR